MAGVNYEEIIQVFKKEGVVAVPIFSGDEVARIREELHASLEIDHAAALGGDAATLERLGGARMKSKAANLFADDWKFRVVADDRVLAVAGALMAATFGPGDLPGYEHPLGRGDDIRLYLDRCQYRLPDHVRGEGGLGLHLDRNPKDPYFLHSDGKNKTTKHASGLLKFRPIQSFISLTDQYGSESGGLRVVRGFHKEIDDYFARSSEDLGSAKGGEFFRMDSKIHASLWKRAAPVDAPAGSIVFWDNRLAHATCEKLTSHDSREVLYTAYVPSNELNRKYIQMQLENLRRGLAPPAYNSTSKEPCHCGIDFGALTMRQKEVLGLLD